MSKSAHPNSDHLLTKREAAEYLGIAPRTLDDWRQQKVIPCIERPGFVRFWKKDLISFLERHRVAAKPVTTFRRRRKKRDVEQSHHKSP